MKWKAKFAPCLRRFSDSLSQVGVFRPLMAMKTHPESDEQLVALSLRGDQSAYGRIVERYQSLVCALTYAACGDVHLSEEVAQDTFVAGWRQVGDLKEPHKLKAWLCGIARNLLNNTLRRRQREPAALGSDMENQPELCAADLSPREQAISREEEALLWQTLQALPPAYREPMVLYYRQSESVADVAVALGLSEEAVRQRLSRGRSMLAGRVEQLIRKTLRGTAPTGAFTLAVMAALPLAATTAKAAAVATGVKGGIASKSAASLGGVLAALVGLVGLGGFVGDRMGRDAGQSAQRREWVVRFWCSVVVGIAVFVLPALCAWVVWKPFLLSHPQVLRATVWWTGAFYAVVGGYLLAWIWRRRRSARHERACSERNGPSVRRPLTLWVVLAMGIMGAILVLAASDSLWKTQRLAPAELRKLVSERKDATFHISLCQNGSKWLVIKLRERGKHFAFEAPVNDATLALLAENGINCPTHVQGRDFEVLGAPGRCLAVLAVFVLAAGAGVLLYSRRTRGSPSKTQSYGVQRTVSGVDGEAFRAGASCRRISVESRNAE